MQPARSARNVLIGLVVTASLTACGGAGAVPTAAPASVGRPPRAALLTDRHGPTASPTGRTARGSAAHRD